MSLTIQSSAFQHNGSIPTQHTCDGPDTSPPLEWSAAPAGTKSFALIVDDPDAPDPKAPKMTYVHWVLYDLPASTHAIGERASIGKTGVNDFGKKGFGGPCPPTKDGAHHYRFHVYALDVDSLGRPGLSKREAMDAMDGHILAEGELTGTYKRASV